MSTRFIVPLTTALVPAPTPKIMIKLIKKTYFAARLIFPDFVDVEADKVVRAADA